MLNFKNVILSTAALFALSTSMYGSSNHYFDVDNAADTVTLSGNISGNGTINKRGPGTVILSGTNTHTGGATIHAGTLSVTADSALGSTAASRDIKFVGNGALAATGSVNVDELTINSGTSATISPASGKTLSIATLLGAGNMTASGGGTVAVSSALPAGAGSYTVDPATTFKLANALTTGTGTTTVQSTGILDLTTAVSGSVPSGALTLHADAVVKLAGNVSYANAFTFAVP